MCIIISLVPKEFIKEEIKKDTLINCWNSNLCGAGYSFVELNEDPKKNIVIIKKGYFKFKLFYKDFLFDRNKYPKSVFLVHMRNATVGIINKENTQPFYIDEYKKATLAHNGTIYKLKSNNNQLSDSSILSNFVSKLPLYWYINQGYRFLFEKYIGDNNRVAILTSMNKIHIFNKEKWIKEEDIIYSSDYYKNERKKETTNSMDLGTCEICKDKKANTLFRNHVYCMKCFEKVDPKDVKWICKECGIELIDNEKDYCVTCQHNLEVKKQRELNIYEQNEINLLENKSKV